jgi:hypothetical protein
MPITLSDWAQLNPSNFVAANTLASAGTLAPTTFLTVLTGNVAITAITPPVPHGHMLCIVFAGTAGITAGNNIGNTKASVAGEGMLLVYNPTTAKYTAVG